MRIERNDEKKRFEAIGDDGATMGWIVYEPDAEGRLAATHTMVLPEHRRKGVAGQLLDALAAYARERRTKIVPVCPYVVNAFRDHADKYADVTA